MKIPQNLLKDLAMLIIALVVLVTGIVLHLKVYGVVVEPRAVIKVVHYVAGFLLVAMMVMHFAAHAKWYGPVCKAQPVYGAIIAVMGVVALATFVTGLVKLCAHVRGLGAWHFWLGIALAVFVVYHISKGLPYVRKMLSKKQ
jgi:hypothetical protein